MIGSGVKLSAISCLSGVTSVITNFRTMRSTFVKFFGVRR
jgi:hypothetical protein